MHQMKIRYLLYSFLILALAACGSSKSVNFLGIQEEPKKSAVAPNNSSFEQNQSASATKTDKKESNKIPKYLKNYIEDENYIAALSDFEAELENNTNAADINYYVAESYRKLGRPKEAIPYYEKAIAGGYDNAELEINYAMSLKANEQYEEAKRVLEQYVIHSSVEADKERAEAEIKNLSKLDSISLLVRNVDVELLNEINTENSEYSPSYYNGDLYYVSLSEPEKFDRYDIPYSDIYRVKLAGLKVDESTAGSIPSLFNELNINEGSISFSPDGNTAVFAKGNSNDNKGRRSVDLFISSKKNGTWSKPVSMPINSPSYWDTTPVFNNSGNTIYFASDRPGGYGGSDIYRATLNARGRWSDIANLGPEINTASDEVFPYVSPDNKLYFASDGHAGFGQLDLFEAVNRAGTVTVKNLGPSFNTSADDFGLIYSDFPFEGFLSSNRDGGVGADDIYSFIDNSTDLKQITYVLKGTTYQRDDDSLQTILGNVQVKLMDENGVMLDDIISSRAGSFSFSVEPERIYTLIGDKENFFTERGVFSTVGERVAQEDLVERLTEKILDAEVTLDPIILNKAIILSNIYYDLNRADIRADAAAELDKLVVLLADNSNVRIELSSHTDSRAGDDFNQDLSQRRAQISSRLHRVSRDFKR